MGLGSSEVINKCTEGVKGLIWFVLRTKGVNPKRKLIRIKDHGCKWLYFTTEESALSSI